MYIVCHLSSDTPSSNQQNIYKPSAYDLPLPLDIYRTRPAVRSLPALSSLDRQEIIQNHIMSQEPRNGCSSIERLRGRSYPVCLRSHPATATSPSLVTAIFPQLSSGIGVGATKEEALRDAKYILALGLQFLVEASEEVPEPLGQDAAEQLLRTWEGLSYVGVEVSWDTVEVLPECLAEGLEEELEEGSEGEPRNVGLEEEEEPHIAAT